MVANSTRVYSWLERIGLPGDTPLPITGATLRTLQYHQCTRVPYENLDILYGIPIRLDTDSLFEKIVLHRRGGYCFEVNGLFTGMLREIGFHVTEYFARFLRGEAEVPMRRHRVLLAEAEDGSYLCDVGIGQVAPRYPIRFQMDMVQEQFGETYRLVRDPVLGIVLQEIHDGAWRNYFSFFEEPQYDVDFIQPSFYCEHHPDSPFTKQIMLALKTGDCRKTLDDRVFHVFQGKNLIHSEENLTNVRLLEVIQKEFLLTEIKELPPCVESF